MNHPTTTTQRKEEVMEDNQVPDETRCVTEDYTQLATLLGQGQWRARIVMDFDGKKSVQHLGTFTSRAKAKCEAEKALNANRRSLVVVDLIKWVRTQREDVVLGTIWDIDKIQLGEVETMEFPRWEER
jgi:hypothetical protein